MLLPPPETGYTRQTKTPIRGKKNRKQSHDGPHKAPQQQKRKINTPIITSVPPTLPTQDFSNIDENKHRKQSHDARRATRNTSEAKTTNQHSDYHINTFNTSVPTQIPTNTDGGKHRTQSHDARCTTKKTSEAKATNQNSDYHINTSNTSVPTQVATTMKAKIENSRSTRDAPQNTVQKQKREINTPAITSTFTTLPLLRKILATYMQVK